MYIYTVQICEKCFVELGWDPANQVEIEDTSTEPLDYACCVCCRAEFNSDAAAR